LFIALFLVLVPLMQSLGAQAAGQGLLGSTNLATAWATTTVHGALGVLLLAGGLGLRWQMNWGRILVLWSLWLSLAAGLFIGAVGLRHVAAHPAFALEVPLSVAGTVVLEAVWLLICWLATRALCRPEVKDACGVEVPLPEGLR
jgi:hypothetical protein